MGLNLARIFNYTTTVAAVTPPFPSDAHRFGVTSDTIRWSNGLTGDNLDAGRRRYFAS